MWSNWVSSSDSCAVHKDVIPGRVQTHQQCDWKMETDCSIFGLKRLECFSWIWDEPAFVLLHPSNRVAILLPAHTKPLPLQKCTVKAVTTLPLLFDTFSMYLYLFFTSYEHRMANDQTQPHNLCILLSF